jgi:hypothetical protein
VILWVNGPFGAGKTTLSSALDARPDVSVVDTERAGYFLQPYVQHVKPVPNFQDWRSWRSLAASMVRAVHDEIGGTVVVPQSVFEESYWDDLLEHIGEPVTALTLHVDRGELERRIRKDRVERGARAWRLEQAELYERAVPWLKRRTAVLDTTSLARAEVVSAALDLIP